MEKVLKVHAINEMWFQSKIREPKKKRISFEFSVCLKIRRRKCEL